MWCSTVKARVEAGEKVLRGRLDGDAAGAGLETCRLETSRPSHTTRPAEGSISLSTVRASVDFPHPDSPTMPIGLAAANPQFHVAHCLTFTHANVRVHRAFHP